MLVAMLPAAAGGCSADLDAGAGPPAPAARPAPVITVTAEQQAMVDAAWASYQKLHVIYIKAGQNGVYDWKTEASRRPMHQYAGGRYLTALERDLDLMAEQGIVRTGAPKVALRRVVSISAASILIETCVDDTDTDTVSKATHQSVAVPGQNHRYPVTLRAGLYPDGQWRWVDSHAERAAAC